MSSTGLWDGWDDDAFVFDKTTGQYADRSKPHLLEHRGEHFAERGPLNIPRPVQGHPPLFQDAASEAGRPLAGRTADAVLTLDGGSAEEAAVSAEAVVSAEAAAVSAEAASVSVSVRWSLRGSSLGGVCSRCDGASASRAVQNSSESRPRWLVRPDSPPKRAALEELCPSTRPQLRTNRPRRLRNGDSGLDRHRSS